MEDFKVVAKRLLAVGLAFGMAIGAGVHLARPSVAHASFRVHPLVQDYVTAQFLQAGGCNAAQSCSASSFTTTGTVSTGDGTAAAPSHTFASDPDTGMYRSAANTLGFSTGGAVRFTVDSAGFSISPGITYYNGGNATISSAGYLTYAGSWRARLMQTNSAMVQAEVMGYADSASEYGVILGTSRTDGESGNTAKLAGFCTDCDGTPSYKASVDGYGVYKAHETTDASGTPGDATINKASGTAAFAAAGTAVTITNSLITTKSVVIVNLITHNDATLTQIYPAVINSAGGSFVVTGNAAATGTTKFNFVVLGIN